VEVAARFDYLLSSLAKRQPDDPQFQLALTVVPTSKEEGQKWRYTTKQPTEGWQKADFDDKEWQEGVGGFGTHDTKGAVVRTSGRRTTSGCGASSRCRMGSGMTCAAALPRRRRGRLRQRRTGAEGARLARRLQGDALSAEARTALKPGKNVLAVHCHNISARSTSTWASWR